MSSTTPSPGTSPSPAHPPTLPPPLPPPVKSTEIFRLPTSKIMRSAVAPPLPPRRKRENSTGESTPVSFITLRRFRLAFSLNGFIWRFDLTGCSTT